MISYILPTRNAPGRLSETLDALGRLSRREHDRAGGAEVVVVDNAAPSAPVVPSRLANGIPVVVVRLPDNRGAAGRNVGVERASGRWVVMLDDDSFPIGSGHLDLLLEADDDVAAIGADIRLDNGDREAGGLPEVIVGCGAAVRREAFLEVGGYDAAFVYYVEEYDLCARLIAGGWRIEHDARFRVHHRKMIDGRDMNVILRRLVRNNGWVLRRYAPETRFDELLRRMLDRYERIADRETARDGFRRGVRELEASIDEQPRRALDDGAFDRFIGRAAVDEHLERCLATFGSSRVAVCDRGKHDWVIDAALADAGHVTVDDPRQADIGVIGTLSPGPLRDAWERGRRAGLPVMTPWTPRGARLSVGNPV